MYERYADGKVFVEYDNQDWIADVSFVFTDTHEEWGKETDIIASSIRSVENCITGEVLLGIDIPTELEDAIHNATDNDNIEVAETEYWTPDTLSEARGER